MDDIHRLKKIIQILNNEGVTWWADHGTLLGLVRERRLIPWDKDIDLSIHAAELKLVCSALKKNKNLLDSHLVLTSRNLKLIPYAGSGRVIDLSCYFYKTDGVFEKHLIMFPRDDQLRFATLRRFFWRLCRKIEREIRRFRVFSDWFVTRNNLGAILFFFYCWITRLRECVGVKSVSRVPVHYLKKSKVLTWRGIKIRVPAESEPYLAYRYGSDWIVPRRKWVWWQDDCSI